MRTRVSKAFTLVEILIVVVILGILAAIVIPQFTNASQDAQRGNVVTQMQSLRNQIELFRVRNNGRAPVLAGASGSSFSELITPPAVPVQDPYLRTVAANPRNSSSEVVASSATGDAFRTAAASADPQASGAAGWLYNLATGEFAAVGFSEFSNTWFGEAGHLTAPASSGP